MNQKNFNALNKTHRFLKKKLSDKRINLIYQKFEKNFTLSENFIVAVSGGPDSLALAFLSKIYSITNSLKIKFYIIDHKIRNNSTFEANLVKKNLKKFYIDAKIVSWKGKKSSQNIQSQAREKRYELLYKECKKNNFNNILVGHHLDDLFENFFIRMLRGSGLNGLISLDKKTTVNNINILRPLIFIKKNDLIYISKKVFNFYVKDPSNDNDKFKRTKIRNFLSNLEKEGLNKKKFLLTINNLKSSNDVIKFYVKRNIEKNVFIRNQENKAILKKNFFDHPNEIVLRSLSNVLQVVGDRYYASRGKKLIKIIDQIIKNSSNKCTLGGCIIEKINKTVVISKEKMKN